MNQPRTPIAARIPEAKTPTEELRAILSHLEAQIGKLGVTHLDHPEEILLLLDQARARFTDLRERGAQLIPEHTRMTSIEEQLHGKRRQLLRALGGARTLQKLREAHQPPEEHWWWFIDVALAHERRTRLRQTARGAIVGILILGVLTAAYQLFLAPDKATQQRMTHELAAEEALGAQDFTTALEEVDMALTLAPGDSDLLTLKGVALALSGQEVESEGVFEQAIQAAGDLEMFHVARARYFLIAHQPELALEDARLAIEANPKSAMAYLQMGNAYAELGRVPEAAESYERAAALAREAGETQLEAMARVQLAYLSMVPSLPTGTLSPVP